MLSKKTVDEYEWRRLHEKLDRAVGEMSFDYLRGLAIRRKRVSTQRLIDELAELRLGREPDYEMPGLPLVYALRYMPKRIVSIFGSLLSVLDGWCPQSVLDFGSGTGATSVALDLLNLPRHINLTGLEASQEMILFSKSSRLWQRVSSQYIQGSITELDKCNLDPSGFDLVVLSACFSYDFDDWDPFLNAIGDYENQKSKMILVVEPEAKEDLLLDFEKQLKAKGWPTITFCCHDLSEVIKDDSLPLTMMHKVCSRLGMDESNRSKTWWNPPDDKFLVANPKPIQTGQVNIGSRFLATSGRNQMVMV
jgi:SAM-dependent methyltransferase